MTARSFSAFSLALALTFGAAAGAADKTPKTKSPPLGEVMDGNDMGVPVDGPNVGSGPGAGTGQDTLTRPVPPTEGPPAPVTFTAYLNEGGAPLASDVAWRVFEGRATPEGTYKLVAISRESHPTLMLAPGEYLINVAYGRASLTRKIGIWPEKAVSEDFVINAGGLRLTASVAKAPITAEHALKFEVYADSQDQLGNRQKVLTDARQGVVFRLNSGVYHIVSTYGDANSVISTDIVVEPGKITDAAIDHDAGKVTFKLVQRRGGEAVADTRWSIQTLSGEVLKESAGAFPTHILAAGEYRVIAQHNELQYGGIFTVSAGDNKLVEVVMQQ